MTTFLLILWLITSIALAVFYFLKRRAVAAARLARQRADSAEQQSQQATAQARQEADTAIMHAWEQSRASTISAEQALERRLAELAGESDRISQHYANEALRVHRESAQQLEDLHAEVAPLRKYAGLHDAENEVHKVLAEAMEEAAGLRQEAEVLLALSKQAAAQERSVAQQRAKDIRSQAEKVLEQATVEARRTVEAAERRAEQIGGEAYTALRDKEMLEQAVGALVNVVDGYGDRYVVPTRSLLDELAADYGHTHAGEELRLAREQSRRLVELKLAATCKYEDPDRRDRANRFVVDAFNGRVDAILSRTKHDNYGTLRQEVRDAFSTVNLNGLVFHDARILPEYLDARLAELKWSVVVLELRRKEREEQRELQERIHEEEKARREYQRAMQEAAREEEMIRRAMEKARADAANASAAERAVLEERMAELSQKLVDAEAKGQRALSMAQQTRSGRVYVISNVGSFGENVYKIGMTRRLTPEDRIRELSGASVPFEFDVHAMIESPDAPALEHMLHTAFADARINKVNARKEFFRMPLERLREFAAAKGLEVTFTMAAAAREYRETLALENMAPEDREKYQLQIVEEDEAISAESPLAAEQS